jgi:type IV secretory pathway TrbL component
MFFENLLMTQLQLDAPVLGYSLTVPVGLAQNFSHLSPIVDYSVKDNEFSSIAVHISLMTLIAFLLIPLHILFRKRL